MLNPFPDLLFFSTLAPFILRIVIGLIFIDLGILKFKGEKKRWLAAFNGLGLKPADFFLPIYAVIQIVGGLMLILGFYTQVAALVFVVFTAMEFSVEWRAKEVLKRDLVFYILMLAISLSLLLTGAGAYAFDMPL